ncbi:MAG: HAMP domain-containing sensor histidine kinase, partial [Clostridia bacterium]
FVNSLGVVVVLIVIFITTMSFSVQSYVYNGIQQILISRSDELLNVFASSGTSSFTTVSRAYIENFPDKNDMEIMLISKTGNVSVTSTGFQPDQTQIMPDYVSALSSDVNFGYWIGELDTGEKVMAITRVVRNEYNSVEGSLRYVVSITEADEQIFMFILLLITVGLGITLAITFSGIYFVRSILTPVRQISVTAQKISDGNFDVRIEKFKDDEIGQLIDTINIMAEELGNSERMKNDFISSVSHELRTPLTAIKGWAETLEVTEQDEKTRKQGMNIIIKESQRLTGIVEELLDFSRIQNGRMNLNLVKTDVLAELDEVVFLFTERAKSEDKKMIYDDVAILSPIMADMNRLKQVFVNIIDNAIKYTEAGGQIKIVSYEEKEQIFIVVEDTGCGIASEHIPHIKKKFYKANQVVRGSGIGLAVADEIVALHGGELEVQSTLGKGTKVTISLPIIEK